MKNLAEQLINYSQTDYYPFHMPGHKRNEQSVEYQPSIETDITEIEHFDNLHHAKGVIRDAQRRAAKLYGSRETFFSVGGSTAALLSAVSACVFSGEKLLLARNCHKAVYHAVYLRNLKPVYLYPEWEEEYGLNGGILPEKVDEQLSIHRDIKAVIITSPTYDGVVSDVKSIAAICHQRGIPLIVDEAHGAHFRFHGYFPESALENNADVVVQSVHKTLPSMTQTALLHRNSERVSSERLQRFMSMYQSSSPSYPMMASIDSCICALTEHGKKDFDEYVKRLKLFYIKIRECRQLQIVNSSVIGKSGVFDRDASKIIINTKNVDLTGKQLYQILLEQYHLQMEMEAPSYVLGITSVADTEEGFERLADALIEIDRKSKQENSVIKKYKTQNLQKLSADMEMQKAVDSEKEAVLWNQAAGRISGGFVSLYPPGIPLIVPGERVTEELMEYISWCLENGYDVHGIEDGKIEVVML